MASKPQESSSNTFYLNVRQVLPGTTMKFGSDDYFALLKQKPRLADFFALGERIVVVFEGKVYRITAAGQ